MREARLFGGNKGPILVNAEEVKEGKYDRYENFIDIEEEFRVNYVSDSKGHGGPYFRLYLTREEYKKLSNDQKDRYDILRDQRRYKESPWHREWKEKLSPFCRIEKSIRNEETGKYKIADAIFEEKKTIVELQHSYIANDFEERNAHYSSLGYNVIWLYDLPRARLKKVGDNEFEILEDNAKGFFRIAEKPNNLLDYTVFIQTHDKNIFLIKRLERKAIDSELKSTIRSFKPILTLTESEFLRGVEEGSFICFSIYELWDPAYYSMIVKDMKKNETIIIRNDKDNPEKMSRNYEFDNIGYNYMNYSSSKKKYYQTSMKYYDLNENRANDKRWVLIEARYK